MNTLQSLFSSETGHAYTGYGIGSAVALILIVLLLFILL